MPNVKSKRYQYKFREVGVESLDTFKQEDAMYNQNAASESSVQYKEEIFQAVLHVADEQLTERQKQILYLRFVRGMTQVQIGLELSISQGCVSLQINGIPNYIYNKKHGGILPKLKRICVEEAAVAADEMNDDVAMEKLLRNVKGRIRKAHPEYTEVQVVERAVESISKMGTISELLHTLMTSNSESEY
jgi:DNA-binding CsgD family transcriptional regulator